MRGIQLLAHSRGAAVALLAVREFAIEAIAAGDEPAESTKLEERIALPVPRPFQFRSRFILSPKGC